LHGISFRPTCFGARPRTPGWVPVQRELKTERFGITFRCLLACAFVRPESEQNSSHPRACTAAKVERWIDCPVPRQSAPKRSRRPKARTSSWPASATTTIYEHAGSYGERRRADEVKLFDFIVLRAGGRIDCPAVSSISAPSRRGDTCTCGRMGSTCRREWKKPPNAC
jgi:hypothetical protein